MMLSYSISWIIVYNILTNVSTLVVIVSSNYLSEVLNLLLFF
jgi:hypothetical protein